MKTSVPLLLSSLALAACGEADSGYSNIKLVELETTIQNGSSTEIQRLALSYDGSQLREIARFENGAPAGTARPTYGAGGIVAMEYADAEGDRATEQLTYEGGRLIRTRHEIPGIRVNERTISYDAGAVKEVSILTTVPGATATTSVIRYEYDADGHTTKQLEIEGDETSSTELRYTADGLIERASMFDDGAHRETYTFELDAGRIAEVVDSRNGRHEVTYDSEGRISEIRHSTSSGTTTYVYKYGTGNVDGLTFAPDLPVAPLLDLTGATYGSISMLHGVADMIPRDLPRASGGGGGGGGGGTCSFEPADACETCLAASCCSETEACFAGTACDSFYQCASACTDQTCIDVCRETNPTGASDQSALASCAQAFCPSSCGS